MSAATPDNPQVRAADKARAPAYTYAAGTQPLPGYTIKRGLGQGGFGEVYYALSDAGKEVALKVVRRNLDVELRGVTQCLNLKHQNLVGLFDVRTDAEGNYWIVMEYVAGERLVELIERHPQGLPPVEAVRLVRGIAAAVAYLHDNGIVHRDLKPANIFVENGIVKIGDYGLSKFISVSRRSGQTESVGTVHYMAPEIANGRYGKQIDVYALGVLLYELLTGRVPFDGESVGEILMKHLTAEPDLSPAPEPYRSAIAAALEKDPERRTKTVEDFLRQIDTSPGAATYDHEQPRIVGEGFARRPVRSPERPRRESGVDAAKPWIERPLQYWPGWVWVGLCFLFPPAILVILPMLYFLGRSTTSNLGFPWHGLLLGFPVVGLIPLAFLFVASHSPLEHSNLFWGNVALLTVVACFFVLPIIGFIYLQRHRTALAGGEPATARGGVPHVVRNAPHAPSYVWVVVPLIVLVFLMIFGLRAAGPAPTWPMLGVPAVIAIGFSVWIADWVRRRRAAVAAKYGSGDLFTSTFARAGFARPAGASSPVWMFVGLMSAGLILLGVLVVYKSREEVAVRAAENRAIQERMEAVHRRQAVDGISTEHVFDQDSLRMPDGAVANPPRAAGAQPPGYAEDAVVATPEYSLRLSLGMLSVLVILGTVGLTFWLARRGHEHHDPTLALSQPRGDFAETQAATDLPQPRGPPISLRRLAIDVTGGLLLTFAATLLGTRLLLIFRGTAPSLAQYLWTSASIFTGAALWIGMLKIVRPTHLEGLGRRAVSMFVGILTGAAAWFYADYLGITLPIEAHFEGVGLDRWPECYQAGRPTMLAFAGYFGLVFTLVDWWSMTSPARRSRWQLSDVFVAVFWAFLVHMLFPFPQWWGLLVVAGCAAVLPTAFPNMPKPDRVRMRLRGAER